MLLALPLLSMVQCSYRLFGDRQFPMAGLLAQPERVPFARPYNGAVWPQGAILEDLCGLGQFSRGERRQLLVASDRPHFNGHNFRLTASVAQLPFNVTTSAYVADRNRVFQRVLAADYVVYEEGGEAESSYNPFADDIAREVQSSAKFVPLAIAGKLPDGGVAHVFMNVDTARSRDHD